jgi:hypothetical protein
MKPLFWHKNNYGLRVSELLLKRKGTILYRKDGTRVPSLKTVHGSGVYRTDKTRGRRKMFITRASAAG